MSKYSDSIKQTANFFKDELKVFNFSFIGTSVYISVCKEHLPLDETVLKNIKGMQCSSFLNNEKISHDSYESAIKDLEEGITDYLVISGEAKAPLFNNINNKFVEIYNSI